MASAGNQRGPGGPSGDCTTRELRACQVLPLGRPGPASGPESFPTGLRGPATGEGQGVSEAPSTGLGGVRFTGPRCQGWDKPPGGTEGPRDGRGSGRDACLLQGLWTCRSHTGAWQGLSLKAAENPDLMLIPAGLTQPGSTQICEAPEVTSVSGALGEVAGGGGIHSFIHSLVGPSTHPFHSFRKHLRGLHGGLVAKTPCSQCRGPGFHLWSGS